MRISNAWKMKIFTNSYFLLGPEYGNTGDPVYHAYYQWVPFFLSLQILLFYAPYWIWKQLEGGHMKKILCGLENLILDRKESKIEDLADFLKSNMMQNDPNFSMKYYSGWAIKFLVCECLNFANVIGQIYFIDKFLGGEFLHYGIEVLKFHFFHDHKGTLLFLN